MEYLTLRNIFSSNFNEISIIRMDIDWQGMQHTLEVGDWKLLYILSKNMESMAYEEFLYELSRLHNKQNWFVNDKIAKTHCNSADNEDTVEDTKPIFAA